MNPLDFSTFATSHAKPGTKFRFINSHIKFNKYEFVQLVRHHQTPDYVRTVAVLLNLQTNDYCTHEVYSNDQRIIETILI